MPDPDIHVSSNVDRPAQREQLVGLIQAAQAKGLPIRMRLPLTIMDYDTPNRDYRNVRDASWTLALPSAGLEVEAVERIITVVHVCLRRVEQVGAEGVLVHLGLLDLAEAEPADPPVTTAVEPA